MFTVPFSFAAGLAQHSVWTQMFSGRVEQSMILSVLQFLVQ